MLYTTLRPGLLVSVRTSIKGNVSYRTIDLGHTPTFEGGEESRWETEKLVRNKDEQERATKARSAARSAIQTVCAHSDFGLLCPLDKEDKLEVAIAVARDIVREFNDSSDLTKISFNVLRGKVEQDDVRAVRAINEEVRDLIDAMTAGAQRLDVEAIRNAANKARSVGQMLTPDAQSRIQDAIDTARKTAREIVKAGEGAAIEVDRLAIERLQQSRTAFLDLDEGTEVQAPTEPGRAVDFDVPPDVQAASVSAPAFDL
jgi:hypothetical protein